MYRSLYYGIFDSLRVPFSRSKEDTDISFPVAFFIGQVSSMNNLVYNHDLQIAALVAAMFSYPLDTVRRRLMMQSGRKVRDYSGALDCARKIYATEGSHAFFSGFFVNAVRGVGAALVLAIYNDISKFLK